MRNKEKKKRRKFNPETIQEFQTTQTTIHIIMLSLILYTIRYRPIAEDEREGEKRAEN